MSKFNEAFDNLRAAWDDFTMAVGLAIIGERETDREKQIDQQRRAAIVGRDAYQRERDDYKSKWQASCKTNDLLLKECDEYLRIANEKRDAVSLAIKERDILANKYMLLDNRYKKLRDRTISKPKRKRKAKKY